MNKILFLSLLTITALQSMEQAYDAMIAALMTPTAPLPLETPSDSKKKYQCNWPGCSKIFDRSCNLKAHKYTHTGEKPHACETCGKSFNQSCNLTRHIRIHTGEKPYVCKHPDCDKSFTQSNNIKAHMRTHTGEKLHTCETCSKNFTTSSYLKKHIRTQHPIPSETESARDEHTSPILGKRTFEPLQETENDNEKQQHLLDMLYAGAITLNAGIDPFTNEDQKDVCHPELQRLDYE